MDNSDEKPFDDEYLKGDNTLEAPDAFDMFCYASAYQEGASIINNEMLASLVVEDSAGTLRQNPNASALHLPAAILLSLSFEVYLKCLIAIGGGKPHGHDADKLFTDLDTVTRDTLEKKFASLCADGAAFREMKLESVLTRMKKFFKRTRYGYELKIRMPSDGVRRGTFGLWNAVEAARSTIADMNSDWEERRLKQSSLT